MPKIFLTIWESLRLWSYSIKDGFSMKSAESIFEKSHSHIQFEKVLQNSFALLSVSFLKYCIRIEERMTFILQEKENMSKMKPLGRRHMVVMGKEVMVYVYRCSPWIFDERDKRLVEVVSKLGSGRPRYQARRQESQNLTDSKHQLHFHCHREDALIVSTTCDK